MRKRSLRRLSFVLATSLGLQAAAWALTVEPGRTEVRLSPGGHEQAKLTVTNDAKELVQSAMEELHQRTKD